MQRKTFQIKLNGQPAGVKFAWNAALRAVRQIAQENANRINGTFEQTASALVKEDFGHVRGVFTWSGSNGETLAFEIEKL